MLFRGESNVTMPQQAMPGTGTAMPQGTSPAGAMNGLDAGLQAYKPMQGRADKHASNIVNSFTNEYMGHGNKVL